MHEQQETIPTTDRTVVTVPLNKLKKSPKNVRKVPHAPSELDQLAASIAALGMLQYSIVEPELSESGKPTGHYLVNAGEGRRQAQLLRVKRKEIAKDEPIFCLLDTGHSATEISLAENAIRSAMHPADEYEAFAALHAGQSMAIEDIAARFGVSPAVVRQRLKLAAVSPALLTHYREGGMNLEQLMAFTITDDHARQEEVWASLGWDKDRRAILRALTDGQIEVDDRRVIFVGLEAYEAAGGAVVRDLFDDENSYLTDTVLLDRLVREKLQAAAAPVLAEGWKWAEVDPEFDYSRTCAMASIDAMPRVLSADDEQKLEALQARLETLSSEAEQDDASDETLRDIESLEAEIEALTADVFQAEDIARAGVFVALSRNGDVRIERGYLRPEDEHPTDGEAEDDAAEAAPSQAAPGTKGLSAALVAELTAHRTMALRNDLAQAPETALLAVTHALAARTFYRFDHLSCLGLILNQAGLEAVATGIGESVAGKAISARHEAWAERLPEDGNALWTFIASLGMDERMALLAHCASQSLNAVQRPGSGEAGALAHASVLADVLPHDPTRYWQPTVSSYLGRVSKELILEAVREGAGEEAARQIADLKKQAMADRAEKLLDGKGWLPPLLSPQPKAA